VTHTPKYTGATYMPSRDAWMIVAGHGQTREHIVINGIKYSMDVTRLLL
jgi:hypothetical protein